MIKGARIIPSSLHRVYPQSRAMQFYDGKRGIVKPERVVIDSGERKSSEELKKRILLSLSAISQLPDGRKSNSLEGKNSKKSEAFDNLLHQVFQS